MGWFEQWFSKNKNFVESLPEGANLEMVAIPGGKFRMGSIRHDNSQPIHNVKVKPFFMGKYPVTRAQWKSVMGHIPSSYLNGDTYPIVNISWKDAKAFCQTLAEMTGKEYRLPSEAEWEYACRAGGKEDYWFGADRKMLRRFAWYEENSDHWLPQVGLMSPNPWGLYDVYGTVWEFCEDHLHNNYAYAPTDGSAWLSDGLHVMRGGSWNSDDWRCTSAYRIFARTGNDVGFRVVCGSGII